MKKSSSIDIVYHDDYLKHLAGVPHPESPQRLTAIMKSLKAHGVLSRVLQIEPREATKHEICLAHSSEYVRQIEAFEEGGGGYLDMDTPMGEGSYRAACLAAGGVLTAIDCCLAHQTPVFALVRPPGHHAERARAMGFCLFNNVGIGALYALGSTRVKRILLIDWDVHHGNGTENLFYHRNDVLYFSIHQSPCYPGTGSFTDIGAGEGEGFNINVPLPLGVGDAGYALVFKKILMPVATSFEPDLVLVSAGQDAHHADPLAQMNLTTRGYYQMAKLVKEIADAFCPGKVALCLEGGYNLTALSHSVLSIMEAFGEWGFEVQDPLGEPTDTNMDKIEARVLRVSEILAPFWPCLE